MLNKQMGQKNYLMILIIYIIICFGIPIILPHNYFQALELGYYIEARGRGWAERKQQQIQNKRLRFVNTNRAFTFVCCNFEKKLGLLFTDINNFKWL
jgi:hypothetical protein